MAGALPKTLKSLGHEVRVVTPRYRSIRERRYGLREVSRLRSLNIRLGDNNYTCSVKSGFIPGSKVQVYFLEVAELYDRIGLYIDPATKKEWTDNHFRFAFLNHASLQLMQHLQWFPDIIHCNDWHTALIPCLLHFSESYNSDFSHTRTVFHLHNAAFQGVFPLEATEDLCLGNPCLEEGNPFSFHGKLSFMKGGAEYADQLVTVSPTYSREIQSSPESGCGLEGLFTERKEHLSGILNGVDNQVWNPETDRRLTHQYGIEDFIEGKAANKEELQKRVKLPVDPDIPLIGMVSRFSEQKGFDLLFQIESDLLSMPAQFVFLGSGDDSYALETNRRIKTWQSDHPEKIAVIRQFNNNLAHLITAGSDIFAMPSRFEPCGLNQMYSMLYGTIPVVHKTGGLADTVIDNAVSPSDGNGFTFDDYNGDALLSVLKRAVAEFAEKSSWQELQLRGMQQDFSWERSAVSLVDIYEQVLSRPSYRE